MTPGNFSLLMARYHYYNTENLQAIVTVVGHLFTSRVQQGSEWDAGIAVQVGVRYSDVQNYCY